MASDGPTHLLSLKVMRVSRPELASSWAPFYSSSPSFSAHSSASITSLQGAAPLPGHPKTLRDLTHATELLTLPSSFGSIQLGETFSSCLCVNNEATSEVELRQLKVEMQTTTTKVTLSELDEGGATRTLGRGESVETIVHHEIKELGQHVLACTVTYRLPANARPVPGSAEDANDPSLLTFRKFYKFAVTNPLSVKTKVHVPKSPSATLSLEERDKMFLEVHIQNLTPDGMFFEQMRFEASEGWNVDDVNIGPTFAGTMQPQDTRQYIYILTPKSQSLAPPAPVPGSIIPLGRLDISWRSSLGEPGRLLTSMLTRRIPFPAPTQQPVSAVPPYLKRNTIGGAGPQSPSRPQSPQIGNRPISPPPAQRPGSPFHNRPQSLGQAISPRPQSPQIQTANLAFTQSLPPVVSDVEVSLVVRHLPRNDIAIEKPFKISFALVVTLNPELGKRRLAFAVQHLRSPKVIAAPATTTAPVAPEAGSPRIPSSGFATPVAVGQQPFNYAVAHQRILDVAATTSSPIAHDLKSTSQGQVLPPPYYDSSDELKQVPNGVTAIGASAIFLPPVEMMTTDDGSASKPLVQEFQLEFVPVKRGFVTVGGLRILLVGDSLVAEAEGSEESRWKQNKVQTLKEYDVVAEIWVAP